MTNATDFKFKPIKFAALLFLFQMVVVIVVVVALRVYTEMTQHSLAPVVDIPGMVGTVTGSLYYGVWMEKRYPGMLDSHKIKILALLCVLIYFVLANAYFFIRLYLGGSAVLHTRFFIEFTVYMGFVLFALLVRYVVMFFCIKQGIKIRRRLNGAV